MSTKPESQHAHSPQIVAEITSAHQVVINGEVTAVDDGGDPYQQVFATAQQEAARRGGPVTVHGTDHLRAEESMFSVNAEGAAQALDAGPEAAVRPEGGTDPEAGAGPEVGTGPAEAEPGEPGPAESEPGEPGPAESEPGKSGPAESEPGDAGSSDTPAQEGLTRLQKRRLAESGHPSFVTPRKQKPVGGLRRTLFDLSAGAINMGPSEREKKYADLTRRIARPLQGSRSTAVLSLKGGIGKTSTTVGVGMTMAQHRGDIPCAIDANPDSGDLAERALGERDFQGSPRRTITDLLTNLASVNSLTQLQSYIHQADRLHVLAGEQDPALSDSLTAEEWLRIHREFAKYYPVILTDCGTGVTHNAMEGILQTADSLVIAAGFAVSGAQRARQTLEWLTDHGYEDLARDSIIVITDKEKVSERVEKSVIRDSLRGMSRRLVVVPFDRAVVDGDRMDPEMLHSTTRRAYMEIAAAIVDGYR